MDKQKLITTLKIIAVPTTYALLLRFVFGESSWSGVFNMMSKTFLFLLPSIVGALTVYFSKKEKVRKVSYRIFIPWIPIFAFFLITLFFALEGWPCLLMILPIFLLAASIGGLIGGYFKLKKRDNNLYISVLTILPLLVSPIENYIGANSTPYKAYTYIDINAPTEKVWNNVVRVREIKEERSQGWLTKLLNFPRPVKAELNFEGVGAYREAIFSNGLVFHETVTEYIDNKKMSFTIKALPHEIPLTTMDEHLVVGGRYFDVLNGTYELEMLDDKTCRLHLWSTFKLTTTFNFYASWWANNIMKDIQNSILKIEKERAENE
ncbi:MAG: SRPBCC family protein [Ginsengibacter sp.]